MYQVVIDTNVLVAAFRSRRGASYRLISLLGDERWRPTISGALILEYESVGARECRSLGIPGTVANDIIDMICAIACQTRIHYTGRPSLPDPDDEFIVDLAVAGRCQWIVTHNVRDFPDVVRRFGLRAVTPGEFLAIIGEKP